MRKILLYIIILIIIFSGYKQVKQIWQENEQNLDGTYQEVKEGVTKWYEKATDSTKELKETLNNKINDATERYEQLKGEVESVTDKISEKREQLDQALQEIEEAKKALDELLEKEKENSEEPGSEE